MWTTGRRPGALALVAAIIVFSSGSISGAGAGRESLNEPATLVATDPAIGKSRPIFDPNPQLANISLGSVSVYEWKDSHGRIIKGGLVKPPDYVPGRRYPLVIQTHGFDAKRFFSVGFSNTANAGRALAARDLIVLQVHEPSSDTEIKANLSSCSTSEAVSISLKSLCIRSLTKKCSWTGSISG
jgi:hypothetical protein